MTSYDPNIIQKFADRLYTRATTIIVVCTILGVIVGFFVGPFIRQALPREWAESFAPWMSAIIFGLIGLAYGVERAFILKLQAQTALCQMHIEKNTRGRTDAVTTQAA